MGFFNRYSSHACLETVQLFNAVISKDNDMLLNLVVRCFGIGAISLYSNNSIVIKKLRFELLQL